MAFRIAPYPGQTYPGRYATHHDIRAYLGFGTIRDREIGVGFGQPKQTYAALESTKLPVDFCHSGIQVPLVGGGWTELYCEPGRPSSSGMRGKSSRHRCHAVCPACKAPVPAGRTFQHKCKGGAE
jgi:hypothetical protein